MSLTRFGAHARSVHTRPCELVLGTAENYRDAGLDVSTVTSQGSRRSVSQSMKALLWVRGLRVGWSQSRQRSTRTYKLSALGDILGDIGEELSPCVSTP